MNLLSFAFILVLATSSLYAQRVYECPLEFTEAIDFIHQDGDDFPSGIIRLDSPRTRQTLLKVEISTHQQMTVLNGAQALPNYMFISEKGQHKQSSFYVEQTPYYQVDWHGNWYFGATLIVYIEQEDAQGFNADIYLDDNDGLGRVHRGIRCSLTN